MTTSFIKNALKVMGLCLCLHQSYAMSAQEAITQANAGAGDINAISLEEGTILINQVKYQLAENLTALSPDNQMISKVLLQPGQKIQFWQESAGTAGQVIIRVKIVSNFSTQKYQR